METKSLTLELKSDEAGIVEGYGAVFGNVDDTGDMLMPGAFAESLAVRGVKMLWQHDMRLPIGVWDDVREDAAGLRVKGRLAMDTVKGREAHSLLKMGALSGLSMGFRTKATASNANNVRMLAAVDLYEVSFVTLPANDLAQVTSIKSIVTERDLERVLIEHGVSRMNAKRIASESKGYLHHRDDDMADPDQAQRDAGVIEALSNLHKIMRQANA